MVNFNFFGNFSKRGIEKAKAADMDHSLLSSSIEKLGKDFDAIQWRFLDAPAHRAGWKTQLWPGKASEDVMLCVFKGKSIRQEFHRQDYFFFNFAYRGDFGALSARFDNRITVHEGECYVGQPYAGYAPNGQSSDEIIIVGVLIQTRAFFKTFFNVLSSNQKLFRFFLNPQINSHSDEYIQLKFDDEIPVRRLLELMIVEYASAQENTQDVIKSLTLALLMLVARQYMRSNPTAKKTRFLKKSFNISENITARLHWMMWPVILIITQTIFLVISVGRLENPFRRLCWSSVWSGRWPC